MNPIRTSGCSAQLAHARSAKRSFTLRTAARTITAWLWMLSCVVAHADGGLASILDGSPAAPGACTRAGGAPAAGGFSLPLGGGLGIGVGGSAIAEFIASVERNGQPPRPAPVLCDAPHRSKREPASLPPSSIGRAAGNPVDVVTGNKYQREVDVALAHPQSSSLSPDGLADALGLPQDDTLNLLFARHFNSRSDFALSLGRGWSHSFETRLARIVRDGRVELQIVQADGRRIAFRPFEDDSASGLHGSARIVPGDRPDGAARRYRSRRIDDGLLDEQHTGGVPVAFVWRWPDGRLVHFDRDGRLESIVSADLDRIRLRRDETGRLVEVRDDAGRTIGFEYDGARLVALRLPDAQRIRYEFDAHRQLVAVRYPDGRTRRYEYDDPRAFHRLTAIVDTDGRRSEYRYGNDGRVVYSRGIGEHETQALRFEYALPARSGASGTTTVRSAGSRSTDAITRFRWIVAGGEPMLVASEGDGCRRCPPIGLRVRIGVAGLAASIGDLHIRYDALGRVVERSVAPRNGRPAWFERFAYASGSPWPSPVLIVRPSVVPGREVRLALRYNERRQVEAIDFAGYLPDEDGAQALRAIVRFDYLLRDPRPARAALHGRLSAIVRIAPDGRRERSSFQYDAQRRLVAIRASATVVHRIERDSLGRAVLERLPDGTTQRREFDRAWRIAGSARRGVSVSFDYDEAGRPRAIEWSGGERWTIRPRGSFVEIESNHGWREWIAPGGKGAAPGPAPGPARGLPVAMAQAKHGLQRLATVGGGQWERHYDDLGRLVETRSPDEGRKRYRYDGFGRLSSVAFDDGSVDSREHDDAGRLVRRLQASAQDRVETTFRYRGAQLFAIEHAGQRTIVRHDDEGRIVEVLETREGRNFHQRFEFDARGHLAQQWLADGSQLRHGFDRVGRAERLDLAAAGSDVFRLLVRRAPASDPARSALEFGNGIRFEQHDDASGYPARLVWTRHSDPARTTVPMRAPAFASTDPGVSDPLPFRRLRWDAAGVPLSIVHEGGEDRYAYDRFGRLLVRERHASVDGPVDARRATHVEYFALGVSGERIGERRRDGRDTHAADAIGRAANGLPTQRGALALAYGAQRRIVEAQGARMHARYRYDAFGRRVAKEVDSLHAVARAPKPGSDDAVADTERRGFLYRDQRLVAETDGAGRILRQYLYWNARPIAVLEQGESGVAIVWLHGDHLGTPIAATNEAARVIWRGDADAFGAIATQQGAFFQPLRLPGQYFDAETGLHDNLLRTYDPEAGRYLEPDPLGLRAGFDLFAYADGNPLVATDPLGLLLFAFDGTGNGATGRNGEDTSNVRKFFEASDDPDKWYMAGVGRDDPASGIAASALDWAEARTARDRVEWMIGTLDRFLDEAWIGRIAPVDVIGFSRGAAMARDFVNRVSSMIDAGQFDARGICVDLRFLGLWDTVAQFGALGRSNEEWELSIPTAVRATFHAVALNEHRSLFPLESALGNSAWVVERGFVGSHADIGGGNAEGDLSDVTLVWMTRMAQSLGVAVRDPVPDNVVVTDPRVHDRNYLASGDRAVYQRDAQGRIVRQSPQRTAVVPGLDWSESLAFLVPFRLRQFDANRWPSLVGRVDLQAYGDWLKTTYGIEVRE